MISLWRKCWKSMQNRPSKIFKYKMIMIVKMKIGQNFIQNGHIFQIIHTEK